MNQDGELDEVARAFREHPGLRSKAALQLVADVLGPTDWLRGPGDDAAVVPEDGSALVVAGEAIWPPFVEADPYGAGVAAVVANVNDVAAMGARPLALVDALVGTEVTARRALEGMRWASHLYGVPVVGGHLTMRDGSPALSAFILGRAGVPLSARNVAPGQRLLLACCLEGRMREDFPFFSSLRERGDALNQDVELLPRAAEAGLCAAARDVSMAGILGSLAMLLEATGAGASVDLASLPRPAGTPLARWTAAFPSYAFLLCCPPRRADECGRLFRERGLTCEAIGTIDSTGELRVQLNGRSAVLADLRRDTITGLRKGKVPRA
ncbi:MAG: hypothetical protein JOZ41_07310 [Chloroflexi bacterium]|nr:hypothetical protein [Chloroflexota bacterium]